MYRNWLASGYSTEKGRDILLLQMKMKSGRLEIISGLHLGSNPSFLCPGMSGIYVAQEYNSGASVLLVIANGTQLFVERQINIEECSGLCHLLFHNNIIVGCCYGSGDIFAVDAALTKVLWRHRNVSERKTTSHAHWSVCFNKQLLCCADLGLDMLLWRRVSNGELLYKTMLKMTSGPRQVILSKDCKFIYIINETNSTFNVLDVIDGGKVMEIAQMRTTLSTSSNYPGAASLSRDGVLYIANRGTDTISAFDVNAPKPHLMFETSCGGRWPRWITLSEKEDFLICCNQKSDSVTSFKISNDKLDICGNVILKNAACAVEA